MKDKILELRREGFTVDNIAKELGCAKSTVSYHLNNNGLGQEKRVVITDEIIRSINLYYISHTLQETAKYFNIGTSTVAKYADKKQIVYDKVTKKERAAAAAKRRRKKLKQMAIDYKGGSCQKCGYNKCNGALEFHHLDPNEKDFGISAKGDTKSWERIRVELDKCILICANCHRELHEELRE